MTVEIKSETALEWFARLKDPSLCIRTGHKGFDELLGNVIPMMSVTEIAGDTGCGKLDLAATIIAEMLLDEAKLKWRVFVLDYNGTFRTERLLGIMEHRSTLSNNARMATLERVFIDRVYTPDELETSFERLMSGFTNKPLIPLVIINNIGAILSDTSFMDENEGSFIQDRILKRMREFCQICGGTIISLNHVVTWRGFPSAALGKTWINAPIISKRIILSRSETNGSLSAQLDVRNSTETPKKVRYEITEKGFCEVLDKEKK